MKKLWKFYWDCGRMGFLDGLFLATQEEIDSIIGEEIYFGEVLGKHSEIYGTASAEDFTEIDLGNEPEEVVLKLQIAFDGNTISGYNPFDYWEKFDEDGNPIYDDDEEDGSIIE